MNTGSCYFNRIYEENDTIWFVSIGLIFSLFQMDKNSGVIQCLGVLPVNYERGESYSAIGKINDKIIIAPYYCKGDFLEFDLHSHQFQKKPLGYNICSDQGTFNLVVKSNNSLFFIGCGNGVVVEVNDQYQYIYHFEWSEGLFNQIKGRLLFAGCECIDHILYLPVFGSNRVVELDMDRWENKRTTIMPFTYKIFSQFFDGEAFWYLPLEGNMLIKRGLNENSFEQVIMPVNSDSVRVFKAILFFSNKTIIVQNNDDRCFTILPTGKILECSNEVSSIIRQGELIHACLNADDMKHHKRKSIYTLYNNVFLEVNEKNFKRYSLDIDYDEIGKLVNFATLNWQMGKKYERNERSLQNFIKLLMKSEKAAKLQSQYGEVIYNETIFVR